MITLLQAIIGFTLACQARGLSPHTIADYQNTLRKFCAFLDPDIQFALISRHQVQQFLAAQTISNKTLLNYHTGLSALWTWAVGELITPDHLIRTIKPPKPEKRVIIPYSEADVRAILRGLRRSNDYINNGTPSNHFLPNYERNTAMVFILLDTGLRVEELVTLQFSQLDRRNLRIEVIGKGAKERLLPFSIRTAKALWKYISLRGEGSLGDPVFVSTSGAPATRDEVYKLLVNAGKRTGVRGVSVHRFRHTFAITYLRNGGDPWTLQTLLGHETMEMVRTYLKIAQVDLDERHRKASPVENWKL